MSWQIAHLRINDAATGRPTPVRLRLTDAQGAPLAPLGRLSQLPSRSEPAPGHLWLEGGLWHYIDGACEVRLPAGPLHLAYTKGPDYLPGQVTLERRVGQMALRCEIQPRRQPRQQGWYGGDCFVEQLSPAAAGLEAAAEGLDFVHLAASSETELLEFSAQEPAWSRDGTLVAVGTWNGRQSSPSLLLMHTHRVVFPLRQTDPGFEHYTLADWAHQAHRKRGFVVWPFHPPDAETLATLLHGEIDALGLLPGVDFEAALHWAYRLWNAGLPIRLAAGSGKRDVSRPVGLWRTWVKLPEGIPFTLPAWIEALRQGGGTISRGPWLSLEVNGPGRGTVKNHEAGPEGTLFAVASAVGLQTGDRLELVANGQVVASAEASVDQAVLTCELKGQAVRWLAARCRDQKGGWLAHTSPLATANHQTSKTLIVSAMQELRSELATLAKDLPVDHATRLQPLIQEVLAAKPEVSP